MRVERLAYPPSMGRRPFLTAEWRHLAMLNYEAPPALLEPLVPAGAELDLWEGRALVSVVGFLFLNTRMAGIPVPLHGAFEEVNLRFYVRREVDGEVRRAVTFLREFVPRPAVTLLARGLYNEPYANAEMEHAVPTDPALPGAQELSYSWRTAGAHSRLELGFEGPPVERTPGTEEEFIAEHYWGYTRQRDGGTLEYAVEHPPWRVARASHARLDCDAARVYGDPYAEVLRGEPTSAFYAEGSAVRLYPGVRIQP